MLTHYGHGHLRRGRKLIATGNWNSLASHMMAEAKRHMTSHGIKSEELKTHLQFLREDLDVQPTEVNWACPRCGFYLSLDACSEQCWVCAKKNRRHKERA